MLYNQCTAGNTDYAKRMYLQTEGFFCRRTTVDVSVLAALKTLLLSLGTALTGTVTNKATNTTYHNMPQ